MVSLAMTTVMFASCSEDEESKITNISGEINGYGYVDMGLSVKWAVHNVGTDSPLKIGDYFAWGEVAPKFSYYEDNSATSGKTLGDINGNAKYDAARANWSGTWRMPTQPEFAELIDNCVVSSETINGVRGKKFTSKINGNSIFFPETGYKEDLAHVDSNWSYYWTSTPDMSGGYEHTSNAYCMDFHELVYPGVDDVSYRYYGYQIRPVSK